MHPRRLSEAFSASRNSSEKHVYDKAAKELPDQYHVFHDLTWNEPSLEGSKPEGQIDFVIVDPEYGFVILEVKGGRCSYEPDLRCWKSTDRNDISSEIKDPFDQAAAASRVILKLLLRQPKLSGEFLPHHHAAIFPDCVLEKGNLRANVNAWQIMDQESLFDFRTSIKTLFSEAFPKRKLQPSVGQAILRGVSSLYGDRALLGKELEANRIREVSDRLIRLTEQQLKVLTMCREYQRCRIHGCAGSGKTTLAIHKAKMLAEAGKDVLLTCFNQPLAQHLRRECMGHERITVGPFLELCLEWLTDASYPLTRLDHESFWAEDLPNHFTSYVNALPKRFDAIVVDEGQDFKENHWMMLEMLLRNTDPTYLYIFSDGGQNIYKGSNKYPIETMPLELCQNVRNTNQIFSVVKRTCHLPDHIEPSGVDGPAVRFDSYADSSEMLALIELKLSQLFEQEFERKDIVVLGTKSQKRTALVYGNKIGPFRLVAERQKDSDLLCMSAQRFKGLESKVVILCELDDDLAHNLKEILYVGLTRPMAVLHVLYQKTIEKTLRDLGVPLREKK